MTIAQIKKELGMEVLAFEESLNENGEFNGWYSIWNIETRVQILMHKDTAKIVKNNLEIDCLGLSIEERISPSTQLPYMVKQIRFYSEEEYRKIKIVQAFDDYFIGNKAIFPDIIISEYKRNFIKNYRKIIEEDTLKELSIPIKPLEPLEPEKPKDLKKSIIDILTMFFMVIVVLFLFTWLASTITTAIIVSIFFLIFPFFLIKLEIEENKKLKIYIAIYPSKLQKYQKELSEYEDRLKTYNSNIQKVKYLFEDENYLINQRFSYLKIKKFFSSIRPEENYKNERLGNSELFFQTYLNKYFMGEIIIDKVIELFKYKVYDDYYGEWMEEDSFQRPTYIPDFIFQHNKSNLIIDIEIDEPYTFDKPIHYLDNEHDSKRNEYFLKNGWVVIRFSEEQVINDPEGCCAEIASLIYYFTSDDSYLEKLKNVPRVYRHRKWTKWDAKRLMNLNFRNIPNAKMEDFLN